MKSFFRAVFWLLIFIGFTFNLSCTTKVHENMREASGISATEVDQLDLAKNAFYTQKYDIAIKLLDPIVGGFNGEPEYFLALCYLNDKNPETTPEQAVKYLRDSVGAGYSLAMWELGHAYELGIGVPEDYIQAIDWYRKHKHATRIDINNIIYFKTTRGDLVEESYAQIFKSLVDKAEKDDAEAQEKVARIYDDGIQVKRNEDKAYYWYSKSARLGNQYSQLMLGYFYCRAIGTEKNEKISNYWFERSSRNIICHKRRGK